MNAVATTCPYCGVGCGVLAKADAEGQLQIEGDPDHAANHGRLCVKGSALGDTIGLHGRLLYPQRRGPDRVLQRASWDQVLEQIAAQFGRIIAESGPDAVAFYVSGQLLTEDYYVVNKLAKGYLGTANIDTNSRLCMSSAVAGHKRAFGEDLVPGCYEDLELADLVVLVGSNTAWCHPIVFQRIVKAKQARPSMRLVVIDPRHTATCELADLHLPLQAGSDVRLFNGLLAYLHQHGCTDSDFVDTFASGSADALQAAMADGSEVAEVASSCGLQQADLLSFYQWFADHPKVVTLFSQGVNQASSGTDKVNSIINCHLLTGRIGHPGMGPFSITGQPNAMGGREVGGLANMLAAHMDLDNATHRQIVQQFWQSPKLAERPGLKAVDLFQAIEQGKVRAVWIMATNPLVSMPDADQIKRALNRCELVVSSDIVTDTDTNAYADILLPALGWAEKDGTVTNSERLISRQRAVLPAPGEARADWAMVCDVARRMGFGHAFDFEVPHQIFDEHVRLTAYRNAMPGPAAEPTARRVLNLAGLIGLGAIGYQQLRPIQWPVPAPGVGTARLPAPSGIGYPDGRARLLPVRARAPVHATCRDYPLVLNTGRIRDQWHTMTRTGRSARLANHIAEPFVEVHPKDALRYSLRDGELARIGSRWGAVVVRVRLGAGVRPGSVFVPIHWSDQFASDARVGAVVNPVVDPISGEPEFKHTPVAIEPFPVRAYGFVLSRSRVATDGWTYWTSIQGTRFTRYELARRELPTAEEQWARHCLQVDDENADWIEYHDRSAQVYRAAYLVDGRLQACVFLSARIDLPARSWLAGLFLKQQLDEFDRVSLLLGESMDALPDAGPVVCSCFGVGQTTIRAAIREHGWTTPAQITQHLRAGGNCGSCVPELKQLIGAVQAEVQI